MKCDGKKNGKKEKEGKRKGRKKKGKRKKKRKRGELHHLHCPAASLLLDNLNRKGLGHGHE